MKKYYVTTPIYYTSGDVHIGHAYCTVNVDALARYKRLTGYDVHFLTGTDEHGVKIEEAASIANKTPKEYVDGLVAKIKVLWNKLEISNDDYIRTTDERHKKVIQEIFEYFLANGDIYKGAYEGHYCKPCESFFTVTQLKDGKLCPDCGREVEIVEEEAYFFKMSKYADELIAYYESHPQFVMPPNIKQEMLNSFLKPGLGDLCVTRTSISWGIPVISDPKHVIYVWIDALCNYISALGYPEGQLFNKFWDKDTTIVHVLGKEITRFHVIYWPIMLLALGLRLPDIIFAHGWFTAKDGKMSKSKGNVVYIEPLLERYGVDAVRYYLLSELSFGQDGVFAPELFIDRLNSDLANDLGNLLSRTVAMIEKYYDGITPQETRNITVYDEQYKQDLLEMVESVDEHMNLIAIDKALKAIFNFVKKSNKYIDETKPWTLGKGQELESVLTHLALGLRSVAILLQGFLVNTSDVIFTQLNIEEKYRTYQTIKEFVGVQGRTVVKQEPLFKRVKKEEEVAYITSSFSR